MINRNHFTAIVLITWILPLITAFSQPDIYNHQAKNESQNEQDSKKIFQTLTEYSGHKIVIQFTKGESHNHPLMAFWLEDTSGRYIQSLYVAKSIAKGYFRYGDASTGRWKPGPLRRPAALPYWGHKRGIKANDGYYIPAKDSPMPDAVTGPTPKADFILKTNSKHKKPEVFNVMMEINQSWNWNHYWHNNKFPDDEHYKTSSQPALVYKATININNLLPEYIMKPIGHSHWSGKNGNLYDDLSTITTALDIVDEVKIKIEVPE